MRQAHRSVCHEHIDLFYPYELQRNNQGPRLPQALAGITISLTVSQFAHLPSIFIALSLPLVFSVLEKKKGKERQTHFHANGVRACSPEAQWNCKYFIFAWEPCAITPQLLSPLFHSFTFFLFLALLPSQPSSRLCGHSTLPPVIWSSKPFTQQKKHHHTNFVQH